MAETLPLLNLSTSVKSEPFNPNPMSDKMKPILFRKWIPAIYEVQDGASIPKPGTGCYTEYIYPGDFHQWAATCTDNGETFGNYTVGLVETPDGLIEMLNPTDIKFIKS